MFIEILFCLSNKKLFTLRLLFFEDKDILLFLSSKIKKIALQKGGFCLSNKYINLNSKVKLKCKEGHIWSTVPNSILNRGSWCAMCNATTGEEICRYVLEKVFNTNFNKIRPNWLLNKSGHRLELDGYNDALKIAFEYQGEQHYNPIKFYGNENNGFKKQLERDEIKIKECEKRGIKLLIIRSFKKMTNDVVLTEIKKQFDVHGLKIDNLLEIDINVFYSLRPKNKNHNDISEIAKNKKGRLLSFVNSVNDLADFECEKGHLFTTKASHVKSGTWCRFCGYTKSSINRSKNIQEAHDLANKYGGKCLSEKYLGSRIRHLFECKDGHKFKRYINELRLHGVSCWCKRCNNY